MSFDKTMYICNKSGQYGSGAGIEECQNSGVKMRILQSGTIFEIALLMEIVRIIIHRGQEPQAYFWRTAAGA